MCRTSLAPAVACVCRRFVIDGNKTILQREEPDQKVEENTFEANEVYAIDICFSSGDGKVIPLHTRLWCHTRAGNNPHHVALVQSRETRRCGSCVCVAYETSWCRSHGVTCSSY